MASRGNRTWLHEIIEAFKGYGGRAQLTDIQRIIAKKRKELPDNYKNVISAVIQFHSSSSEVHQKGKPDVFRKVSYGVWELRFPEDALTGFSYQNLLMVAFDSLPAHVREGLADRPEELKAEISRRVEDLRRRYKMA